MIVFADAAMLMGDAGDFKSANDWRKPDCGDTTAAKSANGSLVREGRVG